MLLCATGVPTLQATTWKDPIVGDWFVAGNWTLGVPASNTDAIIENGGFALISAPGASAAGLFLGFNGQSGGLSISAGGTLTQGGNAFLGRNLNSTGSATISNPGSTWIAGSLRLGGASDPAAGGTGFLRVENAGYARSSDSQLGWGSASTGFATITDSGDWEILSTLDIGFRGNGSLTISAGGTVSSATGSTIGNSAGASGTVTVTGNGSFWENTGPLYIGGRDNLAGASVNGGNGSLRIQSGGLVQAAHIKHFTNGLLEVDNGSTTVAGLKIVGGGSAPPPGGALGDMVVGTTTSGRMEIRNGGSAANHRGYIGMNSGGNGAVLVTNSNSRWLANESVWVGNSGNGSLEIRDGAYVSSVNGYIGFSSGSTGDVKISGTDSLGQSPAWLMSGQLYVGGNTSAPGGSGTLRFSNNGYVQAVAATVYQTGTIELGSVGTTPFFTTPVTFLGGRIQTTGNIVFANNFTLGTGGVVVQTLGFNSTFSGIISGSGGLNKSSLDAGNLTLTGTNTYVGATVIDGSSLTVNGRITSATTVNNTGTLGGNGTVGAVTVNNGGTVTPGNSIGRLTVNGNYNQTSGGKLAIEIGGYTPGTQHDQLAVNGQALVGGTLDVSLVNGFRPNVGDTFAIITSTSENGNFTNINSSGFTVRSDASPTGIVLTVLTVEPLLKVTTITRNSNNILITFDATAGKTYRLERKVALSDATWQSPVPGVSDYFASTNGVAVITHSGGATAPLAFYRLRLLP